MVNNAVVSHNSVNELYYLEEVDSTNTGAKANLDKFGPVGAVYTTSQTAGRGRRGAGALALPEDRAAASRRRSHRERNRQRHARLLQV